MTLKTINTTSIVSETAHFASIPWCRALLEDADYFITPSPSRYVKETGEDALTGRTINTPSTISAWLTMCKKPDIHDSPIGELRALLTLGQELDGYPHVCHGGIQATIMDEIMGNLLGLIRDQRYERALVDGEKDAERLPYVTAELTMRYKRPVPTPSSVCVVVRVVKTEGRKIWVDGAIEDGTGTSLATASGLFFQARKSKL